MRKTKRLLRYDLPLHFVLLLTNWLPDNVVFLRLRGLLAAPFFGRCGRDLRLGRNLCFYNPSSIRIGDNVYIAYGCWFMAGETIDIDDQVLFGPYCVVVSSNHTRLNRSFRYGSPCRLPIVIGRGTWIAANVTITGGSIVGAGALVAAGAVVSGEVADDTVVGGQPAKVLKHIEEKIN